MIANVKFKIEMRTKALWECILNMQAHPDRWQAFVADVPTVCGHREDWRCLLANLVSQEHPGCMVHVGQFTVEIDLPLRYKGSERTLRMSIPARVRSIMVAQSTPEGMRERKFLSCATTQMSRQYVGGISKPRR